MAGEKTQYNVHEAKTHFSALVRRAETGERIVIAKAGVPIAVLKPLEQPRARRVVGGDEGKVIIHETFDDPLPEVEE
jgi:prevent-host-death family protein